MPARGDFPGLQRKPPDKNGSIAVHWVAPRRAVAAGYPEKTVRLHGFRAGSDELEERCQQLWAEMEKWFVEKNWLDKPFVFDGTIGGLIKLYQTHKDSPYQDLDESTQRGYDRRMRQIARVAGKVRLDELHGIDFRRWYKQFRQPKGEGDREHVAGTHGLMKMVRILVKFGAEFGLAEAIRLREEMRDIEFQNALAREQHLTYKTTIAFIARAHERGDHEMAMAQAFQYDGTLRQTDVIGKWQRKKGEPNSLEWVRGLVWQEISRDLILNHLCGKTQKRTGQRAILDLKKYPLIMDEFHRLPVIPEIGPVIIDHKTGQPFEYEEYRKRWREIAREAGIPDEVWNRDSRAGGITQGGDAGADIEDLRQHAAHTNLQTTQRDNRKTLAKTTRVADARVEHRNKS